MISIECALINHYQRFTNEVNYSKKSIIQSSRMCLGKVTSFSALKRSKQKRMTTTRVLWKYRESCRVNISTSNIHRQSWQTSIILITAPFSHSRSSVIDMPVSNNSKASQKKRIIMIKETFSHRRWFWRVLLLQNISRTSHCISMIWKTSLFSRCEWLGTNVSLLTSLR